MRIGVHTSISGSLEKSALKAGAVGANTFQIFSASPRMWKAGVPDPAQIRLLKKARDAHDLFPLMIHDNLSAITRRISPIYALASASTLSLSRVRIRCGQRGGSAQDCVRHG